MLTAGRRWCAAARSLAAPRYPLQLLQVRHATETTVEKFAGGTKVVHCRTSLPWLQDGAPVSQRLTDALKECSAEISKALAGTNPSVTVMTHLLPGAGGWKVDASVRKEAMTTFEAALKELPPALLGNLIGSSAAHSQLISGHTLATTPCFVTLTAYVLPAKLKAETKVSHRTGGGLPSLPSNISFKDLKTAGYSPFVLGLGCRVQLRSANGSGGGGGGGGGGGAAAGHPSQSGRITTTTGDEQLVTRVTNMFPGAHVACEFSCPPTEQGAANAHKVFVGDKGYTEGFASAVVCAAPEKSLDIASLASLVRTTVGIGGYQNVRPVLSASLSNVLFAPSSTTLPLVPLQYDKTTHHRLELPAHKNAKPGKYKEVPERVLAMDKKVTGARAVVCNFCSHRLADLEKQQTLPFWTAEKTVVQVGPAKATKRDPPRELSVYSEGEHRILVFSEADVAPVPSRAVVSSTVYDWREAACPSCRNTVGHIGTIADAPGAEQYTILRVGPVVGDVPWTHPDLAPRENKFPEIRAHDAGHQNLLATTPADGAVEDYFGPHDPVLDDPNPPAAGKKNNTKATKKAAKPAKTKTGKKKPPATKPLPIINVFKAPVLPKLDISRLLLPGVGSATPVVVCDEEVMAAVKNAFDAGETPYLGQLVGKSTRMGVLLKVTRATYLKRDSAHLAQGAMQLFICVQNVGRFTTTGDVVKTVDGVSYYDVQPLHDVPVTDATTKKEIVLTALDVARLTDDLWAEARLEKLLKKAKALTPRQIEQLSYEVLARSCHVQGSEKLSRFLVGRCALERVQLTLGLAERLQRRAEERAQQPPLQSPGQRQRQQ